MKDEFHRRWEVAAAAARAETAVRGIAQACLDLVAVLGAGGFGGFHAGTWESVTEVASSPGGMKPAGMRSANPR